MKLYSPMTNALLQGGAVVRFQSGNLKLELENTKRKHTERVWGNTEFIENKHERKNKITPNPWEKEKKKK